MINLGGIIGLMILAIIIGKREHTLVPSSYIVVIFIALMAGPLLGLLLTFRLKGNTGEAKPVTVEETKW